MSKLVYPRSPGFREWEKIPDLRNRSLTLQEFSSRWELSHSQLSLILGVSRQTVSRWLSFGVPSSYQSFLNFYLYHIDFFWRS